MRELVGDQVVRWRQSIVHTNTNNDTNNDDVGGTYLVGDEVVQQLGGLLEGVEALASVHCPYS